MYKLHTAQAPEDLESSFETYLGTHLLRSLWLVALVCALIIVLLLFRDASLTQDYYKLIVIDVAALFVFGGLVVLLRGDVIPVAMAHPTCLLLTLLMIGKNLATLVITQNTAYAGQTMILLAVLSGFMYSTRWFMASTLVIAGIWGIVSSTVLSLPRVAAGEIAFFSFMFIGIAFIRFRRNEMRLRFDLEHEVKMLRGLLPICKKCKSVRDDQGEWTTLENYVLDNSEAEFAHGLCPNCFESSQNRDST